jgi:hypothetical protein
MAAGHMLKPEVIPETERRAINLFSFKRAFDSFNLVQSSLLAL